MERGFRRRKERQQRKEAREIQSDTEASGDCYTRARSDVCAITIKRPVHSPIAHRVEMQARNAKNERTLIRERGAV